VFDKPGKHRFRVFNSEVNSVRWHTDAR
jgi:hypothetical protein